MAYLATFAALLVGALALRGPPALTGSVRLHTQIETTATILSMFIGSLGVLRYYRRKEQTILFAATGFVGAGLLDGFHTLVTSSYFIGHLPPSLTALIGWTWFAPRVFLAVLLWLSWYFWWQGQASRPTRPVDERAVYGFSASLALACVAFFAWVPVAQVQHNQLAMPRPQELMPALFFLLALIGYLRKGGWRDNPLEHWLIIGLIVSVMAHGAFMAFSFAPDDAMFTAAHLLKCGSYLCILVGVLLDLRRVANESHNQPWPAPRPAG